MKENIYDNNIMNEVMQNFLNTYKPGDNLIKPEQKFIDEANKIVPKEIIDLWNNYGFGEYGDGIIKIVNPEDYMGILNDWLGKEDFTRIPIIVDAFGDIFYYRYLGNNANDISVVDVHYGEIKICSFSYQEFFDKFMMDNNANDIYLRRKLYEEAVHKCGKLRINETYYFKPAIKIAGYEHIDFVEKDNCKSSQSFLLQLKLNEIGLMNKYKDNSSLMVINKVFPTENELTPILGNIIKGALSTGDKIIVFKENKPFYGKIERINIGKQVLDTVGIKDKVLIYLKDITEEQIKNISIINRNILVKE